LTYKAPFPDVLICAAVPRRDSAASRWTRGKKKIVDPFSKKDWYQIKAPAVFKHRDVGYTLVNRTAGTRIAAGDKVAMMYTSANRDEAVFDEGLSPIAPALAASPR